MAKDKFNSSYNNQKVMCLETKPKGLSENEVTSILDSVGIKKNDIDLAFKSLHDNSISLLSDYKIEHFSSIPGVGKLKARKIISALKRQTIDNYKKPTYLSLFSGAAVGCYGFQLSDYNCVASIELLEKKMNIQRYNNKCLFDSGYISGDIREKHIKEQIYKNIKYFSEHLGKQELDVLIATPPCQGMSVANHKKKNELGRNSLVIESIKLTNNLTPKVFIFENVSTFLNTYCTDIDGQDRKIKDAIENNLSGQYNIVYEVINFKNYGNNSSRTRTLVIGVRKDQLNLTPLDVFPALQEEKSLYDVIGYLPSLKKSGEIDSGDIYHQFKEYSPHMREWISEIKEGQSAFDNIDKKRIPHKMVSGTIQYNVNKNGDKYKRQIWEKVGPCIHTRNDILSSQNTVHPTDDRVFSIRELMCMMTIPKSFRWSHYEMDELNKLPLHEKKFFFKKNEMNIRNSIGEAVPTSIFRQIAENIKNKINKNNISIKEIKEVISKYDLLNNGKLKTFLKNNLSEFTYTELLEISEFANAKKNENAAYYTRQDICYSIIKDLPSPKHFRNLRILEPSVGIGNFLPLLIKKYQEVNSVVIDVVDIDSDSVEILKILLSKINVPDNFKINFIVDDFLEHEFSNSYDIVVGNPPFGKITQNKKLLKKYLEAVQNKDTNNIYSFFIEKCLKLGNTIALIVPKSLINSPEFNKTRNLLSKYIFQNIIDFGENGFKGVKIETISFIINTRKRKSPDMLVKVESYITKNAQFQKQDYIFASQFPYWLIYRDSYFDDVASKMQLGIFKAFRDRQITKKHTKPSGNYRVFKSRNIVSNGTQNIKGYDCYLDKISDFAVSKYLNKTKLILVPNLTYNPRACFLPKNSITDGSVAILSLINSNIKITQKDLGYYNTDEFTKFYSIARNRGTRSLNIDNNSVYFFGKLKK